MISAASTDCPAADELDRLVAAFVRIRGLDRLEGAIITRHWLAADMKMPLARLDRLLKLLRWQGLISLEGEHIVTVADASTMRELAVAHADQVILSETVEDVCEPPPLLAVCG